MSPCGSNQHRSSGRIQGTVVRIFSVSGVEVNIERRKSADADEAKGRDVGLQTAGEAKVGSLAVLTLTPHDGERPEEEEQELVADFLSALLDDTADRQQNGWRGVRSRTKKENLADAPQALSSTSGGGRARALPGSSLFPHGAPRSRGLDTRIRTDTVPTPTRVASLRSPVRVRISTSSPPDRPQCPKKLTHTATARTRSRYADANAASSSSSSSFSLVFILVLGGGPSTTASPPRRPRQPDAP